MTVEERIVRELKHQMDALSGTPGPLPTRKTSGPHRLAVAALLAAVVGLGWVSFQLSWTRTPTLDVGGLTLPVLSLEPIGRVAGGHIDATGTPTNSPLYVGAPSRPPEFQPEGDEVPLRQGSRPHLPTHTMLTDPDDPVIYVGDIEGASALVYPLSESAVTDIDADVDQKTVIERLSGWLFGEDPSSVAICRQMARPQGLSAGGDCDFLPDGQTGPLGPGPSPGSDQNLWWPGLPPTTSVVTAASGDTLLWQRPSALTVIFPLERLDGEIELQALDAQGRILESANWP